MLPPSSLNAAYLPLYLQFYKGYDRLLSKYMGKDEGVGLDLTLVITAAYKYWPVELFAILQWGETLS